MKKSGEDAGAQESGAGEKTKYLTLRGDTYYFHRRIPSAVVASLKLGSQHMWRSLETTRPEEALKRLPAAIAEFDDLVASAKPQKNVFGGRAVPLRPRGEGTTKYLLEEHIPSILARYEYGILETDDGERVGLSREDRAERMEMLTEGVEQLYDQAAGQDFSGVEEVAAQLLSIELLIAPPGSFAYQQLLVRLLEKDIELMEVQRDRLRGRMKLTPKAIPLAPRDLPTLLDIANEWKKKQSGKRTVDTYFSVVEEFEALYGALPVAAISAKNAQDFCDHLGGHGLSRITVENKIGVLVSILRFGKGRNLTAEISNPFEAVSFDDLPERPVSQDRRAYEIAELNLLFQSPRYTKGKKPSGQAVESSYWAPLLGPFVGARIEEIAQLRVDDVQCINGHWALRIAILDYCRRHDIEMLELVQDSSQSELAAHSRPQKDKQES